MESDCRGKWKVTAEARELAVMCDTEKTVLSICVSFAVSHTGLLLLLSHFSHVRLCGLESNPGSSLQTEEEAGLP